MDSFEYIVAQLLEDEGYWTRGGVKVNVTKEEKRRLLGKASLPRPEVDVVAFKPEINELLLVECKSYLDSHGVSMEILAPGAKHWKRLKVFHTPNLKSLIEVRISEQFRASGLLLPAAPQIRWMLFAGRIKPGHEERVTASLKAAGWSLRGPDEIAAQLRKFAKRGYENELATTVIKLLERNPPQEIDDSETEE